VRGGFGHASGWVLPSKNPANLRGVSFEGTGNFKGMKWQDRRRLEREGLAHR
jgi:hypothetical protein